MNSTKHSDAAVSGMRVSGEHAERDVFIRALLDLAQLRQCDALGVQEQVRHDARILLRKASHLAFAVRGDERLSEPDSAEAMLVSHSLGTSETPARADWNAASPSGPSCLMASRISNGLSCRAPGASTWEFTWGANSGGAAGGPAVGGMKAEDSVASSGTGVRAV